MAARKTATRTPAQSTPDPDVETFETWDAFWSEVGAQKRTETIRGVTVHIPTDLPLRFSHRLQQVWASESEEDLRALLGDVYGGDVLDQWVEAGMGHREFQVLVVWSICHGSGNPITYRQAFDIVAEANAAGKAPAVAGNRAARRATKTASAAGGGRSRPTSNGSTTSRRRASRT